jgi:predicted GIY-YIG superfamily endonuclease
MKQRYKRLNDYWVYVIKTPDNMYYPGYSGDIYVSQRWQPKDYKNMALEPYIKKWGWDNLEKIVVVDGLTKPQALKWENRLIKLYRRLGCCINIANSGGEWSGENKKKKYKEWCKSDKGKNSIQKSKQKYQTSGKRKEWCNKTENRIYKKVAKYNERHPNRIIITALEAKEMYLLTGFIPDFINL